MTRRALSLLVASALGTAPLAAGAAHPVRPAGAPEVPDAGPAPTPEAAPEEPHHGPVAPAGKPASPRPVAPQNPAALPPELQAKPPPPPKKIENPAEVIYRQKVGDHAFALRVRPGWPKPGETVELVLELAKLYDPPDPTVGDREPARDEELQLSMDKGSAVHPRRMHALAVPGQYGAHVTVGEAGLYTVRISRASGKPGVDASFPLGVGVPTPVRPDDVAATLTPTSHGPVRAEEQSASGGAASLEQVMRQLGEKLLAVDAALSASNAGDAAAQAKAMVELSKAVPGQHPPFGQDRPREFDAQANALTAALGALAAAPDATKLADVEQNHCWKCHAEYRWGVASDVSAWPSFTPAKEGK